MRGLIVTVVATAALAASAPLAQAAEVDVPGRADFDAYLAALDALAADASSRDAANATRDAWARIAHASRELAQSAGDSLASFDAFIGEESANGNASNVRDLARAAASTVRRDLKPAVDAWATVGTYIALGDGVRVDGGVRYPVILARPPPGGFGAFDIRVTVEASAARVVSATAEAGEGDGAVDTDANAARIAAFDARALARLGSSATSVVLGHVTLAPVAGVTRVPVTVSVVDFADADGNDVSAIGLAHEVDADGVETGRGLGLYLALGAVAGLGVAAIFAARKYLKV